MVAAVVNVEDITRYDLKSLEGGFVTIRKMTYGQKLKRQEIAFDMTMESGGSRKKQGRDMSISQMQSAVSEYEFSICIADHNLEDSQGRKLSFTNPYDVRALLPEVGSEIEKAIEAENNFDEESLKDSSEQV